MDDSGKRESDASEQTPPKIKAEDNPWYLLATLYGVPEEGDDDLRTKNRVAWNPYFAGNLDESRRAQLIGMKRHSAEELMPFSPEEWRGTEEAFVRHCKSLAKSLALPTNDSEIDFSNVRFDGDCPCLEMGDTSDKLPREREGVLWARPAGNSRMNSSGRRWGRWRAAAGR
jgi:hypothetical protein